MAPPTRFDVSLLSPEWSSTDRTPGRRLQPVAVWAYLETSFNLDLNRIADQGATLEIE